MRMTGAASRSGRCMSFCFLVDSKVNYSARKWLARATAAKCSRWRSRPDRAAGQLEVIRETCSDTCHGWWPTVDVQRNRNVASL
nr:hypothetical protein CFP56_20496 [Quercus suber]